MIIRQMDKKLMTMYKALDLRDDIDRLYASRKGGGKRLICTKVSMDISIQLLKDYIKKNKERLTIVAINSTSNIRTNCSTTKTWEQK